MIQYPLWFIIITWIITIVSLYNIMIDVVNDVCRFFPSFIGSVLGIFTLLFILLTKF